VEPDDVVEGSLAAEVSLITLDMLEIITEVLSSSVSSYSSTYLVAHAQLYFSCH